MTFPDSVNLCSDEETEVEDAKGKYVSASVLVDDKVRSEDTNYQRLDGYAIRPGFHANKTSNEAPNFNQVVNYESLAANGFHSLRSLPSSVPICRQFWKAGDYIHGQTVGSLFQNCKNHVRIHPKFLHSNATSHKWSFGAIAELLDNAIDEIQNGATYVIVDKISIPGDGYPALLIQDDGGGMDPESLRCCMSFGFSNKELECSIGQYGNGFKTSTMRLGADVIIFSRSTKGRKLTQSVGLLSYTFLAQSGFDDIVVPAVDYEFDASADVFKRLIRHEEKQFSSNLYTLLKWSPFSTEVELLSQFNDIGDHGTKIIVFNLWFNDDGSMELDFESDAEDIMISGAPSIVQSKSRAKIATQRHVAYRFRYSLRAYSSILYLHIPQSFKIILCGRVVDPYYIAFDLKYPQCIKYKPQVEENREDNAITTIIGFLEGSPHLNVHGFSIYHKNRLVLPFLPVVSAVNGMGKGVAGVLEANFIKPTHNKQDFEKSTLYRKLEIRLKDMTVEYWHLHCHLIGYRSKKIPPPTSVPIMASTHQMPTSTHQMPTSTHQMSSPGALNGARQVMVTNDVFASSSQLPSSGPYTTAGFGERHCSLTVDISGLPSIVGILEEPGGLPEQRAFEGQIAGERSSKKHTVIGGLGTGVASNHDIQEVQQKIIAMMHQNKKLQDECTKYARLEKELLLKAHTLKSELERAQCVYSNLLAQLKAINGTKLEVSWLPSFSPPLAPEPVTYKAGPEFQAFRQ